MNDTKWGIVYGIGVASIFWIAVIILGNHIEQGNEMRERLEYLESLQEGGEQ